MPRQDKHAISAVNPDEYAERFVTMLSGRFADYVDQRVEADGGAGTAAVRGR